MLWAVAFLAAAFPLAAPEAEASHQPLIYPISGYVTTPYHTYRSSCNCYHDALDISNDQKWGDPIVAAYGGRVSLRCSGWCGGYGNYIMIDHANGYQTLYAHLQDYVVAYGETVTQGQLVGHEGSTGYSTGPHLHFEVRKNGVKQYIPGSSWQWVTRGAPIPYHYDLNPPPPPDSTPPTTTASTSGTRGDNGWWRSGVTVALSATDSGGSGVASTHRRVDGAGWSTYGGPFGVSGDGGHTVYYYSTDRAGNQEATRALGLSIDTRAPVTTPGFSGVTGDDGWWRSAVTVRLGAADATSGVASTTATRDGSTFGYNGPFTVSGDGDHTVAYASRDRAGNVEATRTSAVRIDATAPATALVVGEPSAADASATFVSSTTPLTLSARDATSGVRASEWTWRDLSGGGAAFTLSGADGAAELAWRSVDRAGNVEAWRAHALHLDDTPPTLALASPPEGALAASTEPLRVEADAADAGAGVAHVEFLVDGATRHVATGAPWAWDWATGDEAAGPHVLVVRAVDRLGHATTLTRNVTTVPTSAAGVEATRVAAETAAGAAAADAVAQAEAAVAEVEDTVAQGPPALPVVGFVLEYDEAAGGYRVGAFVDGEFVGVVVPADG